MAPGKIGRRGVGLRGGTGKVFGPGFGPVGTARRREAAD